MRCAHCEADFTPKTIRRRFCSDRCRKAAWTGAKAEDLVRALEDVDRLRRRLERFQRRRSKGAGI